MRKPKVLVTGGGGLLGHHVVDALTPDHEVEVLDLKRPDRDLVFRQVDMRDLDAVRGAVRGHDRIVHLASIDDGTPVPEADYATVNIQGTWNLFHAAEDAGVRSIVLASSSAAYGIAADAPPLALPIDETHPQRPRRTYDLTKQVMERIAESFARRAAAGMGGIPSVTALRPTLVARPEKTPEMIAELAGLSEAEGHPGFTVDAPVYGGLPLLRTYVTSRDCARAFRLALLASRPGFNRYVIAADDTLGSIDTLKMLADRFGSPPDGIDRDYFAARPDRSPLDTRLAAAELGWRPEDDWPAILAEVRGRFADAAPS